MSVSRKQVGIEELVEIPSRALKARSAAPAEPGREEGDDRCGSTRST